MPSCYPEVRIRLVLGNVTGSEFLLMVGSGSVHDESDPIQILKRGSYPDPNFTESDLQPWYYRIKHTRIRSVYVILAIGGKKTA